MPVVITITDDGDFVRYDFQKVGALTLDEQTATLCIQRFLDSMGDDDDAGVS